MANSATRQVSIFINGREVANQIKSIAGEQKKLNNELALTTRGTAEYEAKALELRKVNAILKEHNDRLRGIRQGVEANKSSMSAFIGIAAGAFSVGAIIEYGKALFGTAVRLDSFEKKARTVFGEALPGITRAAEQNARAIGLTNAQYIAAASNIQDLLIPMGFQRQEAAGITEQLVNVSGALAEWSGGQHDSKQVSEILTKALLGERDELKSLGISILDADVKARLAAKGLDKLTGSSLEQAKAAATLELIMEKSTDAQAQFAKGSGSLARQQAEATAKFAEISEKLSTLLLPVFTRLLDVVGGVADVFTGVVDAIDSVVHPAEAMTKVFDEQASKVEDLQSNIAPLLTRYDELAGKSNLTTKEQDELQKIITTVSGVIPTAIQGFDQYGRALGLNTDKAREFIEVEKARLKFINQAAIQETQKLIEETKKQSDIVQTKLNSGRATKTVQNTTGFGVSSQFQDLTGSEIQQLQGEAAKLQELLKGANAEVSRLKGENISAPAAAATPQPPPPPGADPKALKEADKLQQELTDLIERTGSIREDLLAKQTTDEIAIAVRGVEKRYDAELKKATELEAKGVQGATAQRIELERLKGEEILQVTRTIAEKGRVEAEKNAYDTAKATAEAQIKADEITAAFVAQRAQERTAAEAETKAFMNEGLLSDRENELFSLNDHYNNLLKLAEEYGLNTTSLKEAHAKQQAEIEKKYADKSAKDQEETQKARLAALQSSFSAFGDFVTATFDLLGGEGEKAAEFQKIATLAKIAFDTASAISSLVATSEANPLNAVTFGSAGFAQYVAGFARIIANIGQARKILSGAPKVQQKYTGSYLDVTGAQDGRAYHAQSIATPSTGLLPNFPVLFNSNATGAPVLASERGAEYFVASNDLRNPRVANYVRMIDNITHGTRVNQFATGGVNSTATTVPAGSNAEQMAMMGMLNQALNTLNAILSGGIKAVAVIGDQAIVDLDKRFGVINAASGGYFK